MSERYPLQNYRLCSLRFFCSGIASEHRSISEHVIRKAFLATEESFLSVVKRQWVSKPHIASAGTCCLVGIVCNGLLYTANVGDSRLVLGKVERATREVIAVQLSSEHNASIESVRQELKTTHPHDPQIVVLRHRVWRVKGLIQVLAGIVCIYLQLYFITGWLHVLMCCDECFL